MRIHLPNNSSLELKDNPNILALTEKLFPKKSHLLAGAFINKSPDLKDLRTLLKDKDYVDLVFLPSKESLEVIRHSSAHVMAQAVQELWPDVKVSIGPVIENGFYYDFDSPRPFLPKDLETIEAKMKQIIKRDLEVQKQVWTKKQALSFFKKIKENYKVEIIEDLEESEVSVYKQGTWLDLCRGPHVRQLSQIGAIKVLKMSGAYWRGDENNTQLTRIYGTAFHTEKDLRTYLKNLELAKARDHRTLGKQMNLFYFSSLSPGSPFFTKYGTVIYNELKNFLRELYLEYGYQEVITPQVASSKLFEKSGHTQHFSENMYPVLQKSSQEEQHTLNKKSQKMLNSPNQFFLKPMNCPGHCLLYTFQKHSYKELPWRVADFGRLHRREKTGTLHGLTRVTSMAQDDAHIFCTIEQVKQEIESVLKMFQKVYMCLGLKDYKMALSTRPKNSMGEDSLWEKAETALSEVLKNQQIPYFVQKGEGAFYGPKLDLLFVDAMNRTWQLGTLQCDFNMPRAFGLKYVDSDNQEKTPVLLHRAVLGSLERFIGVYLEHTEGYLPIWLAPVQVLMINISKDQEAYVQQCAKKMRAKGLRVETDLRPEKLGYKIRAGWQKKIPCMAIAGEREQKTLSFSIRLKRGKTLSLSFEAFMEHILNTAQNKKESLTFEKHTI